MEKVFNVYSKFHIIKFGEETEAHLERDITSIMQFENLSLSDKKTDDDDDDAGTFDFSNLIIINYSFTVQ